jgi:HEAT repeat protein
MLANGKAERRPFTLAPGDLVKAQIDALPDEDARVRKTAAENLSRMGDRSAVPALMHRVADDRWYDSGYTNVPSDPVGGGKNAALETLKKLAPECATPALLRAIRSSNSEVKIWAMGLLVADKSNIRNESLSEALVEALKDPDEDPKRAMAGRNVRRLAAESLLKLGFRSAIPALVERVADDVWYDSRYTNVPDDPVSGGKGAALEALRKLAPEQEVPALARAAKSKTPDVRAWALRLLATKEGAE